MKRLAMLLVLLAGCGKSPTALAADNCGGVCGGQGPVAVTVVNETADTLRVYWWWRGVRGDSAHVPPMTSQCERFTATTWAQIEGDLPGGKMSHFTSAFDPTAQPNWKIEAVSAPDGITITAVGTAC